MNDNRIMCSRICEAKHVIPLNELVNDLHSRSYTYLVVVLPETQCMQKRSCSQEWYERYRLTDIDCVIQYKNYIDHHEHIITKYSLRRRTAYNHDEHKRQRQYVTHVHTNRRRRGIT